MAGALILSAVFLSGAAAAEPGTVVEPVVSPERPAIQFQVLETRRISLGDHSLIFKRVAPPVLPEASEVPVPATPSAERIAAIAALKQRLQAKKRESLFVSATVFDSGVTELRWTHQGRQGHAFSNINFNYLSGAVEVETDTTVYNFLLATVKGRSTAGAGTGVVSTQTQRTIPALAEFSPTRSEYLVVEEAGDPLPDEAFAAIEALHVYFDANREKLIAESVKRTADEAARAQWLKDHPPVPKDTVIHFWPIKSDAYPTNK